MSQFDEDAHILAILNEIGHGSKRLADIGARLEGSNSANLIRNHGWSGVLVDADQRAADELRNAFPGCAVHHVKATIENVNALVPEGTHFLSIDVDSVDWWLWANLVRRPALVVIETNPLPGVFVAGIATSGGYGCSVDAAKMLGEMKGYDYLGRNVVNAFFVDKTYQCRYRLPEPSRHRGSASDTRGNVMHG